MLKRAEVFGIINREREYQDSMFPRDGEDGNGVIRKVRDLSPAPGILMLEEYGAKARRAWVDDRDGDPIPSLRQVAKIAAIAVRILEEASESEKILVVGLR
jgi:hypothetical protein